MQPIVACHFAYKKFQHLKLKNRKLLNINHKEIFTIQKSSILKIIQPLKYLKTAIKCIYSQLNNNKTNNYSRKFHKFTFKTNYS